MLRNLRFALCALLLCACQMAGPAGDVSPITGDTITVTPLDAPVDDTAATGPAAADAPAESEAEAGPAAEESPEAAAGASPAEPVTEAEPAAEEEAAPPLKSPEQIQCERRGGRWARAGKSEARTCVKQTRDGGKQCTRGTQCEGLCLARSGSCAPVTPLFGCNEIFEDDGRRVTLCID
jgi:hypothetical protein